VNPASGQFGTRVTISGTGLLGGSVGAPQVTLAGVAVAGDRVIGFSREGRSEVVRCYAAADGSVQWEAKAECAYQGGVSSDKGPRCVPLIADDRVYVLGVEGRLRCLQLQDGRELWQRDTERDFRPLEGYFGVGSTPVLHAKRLIVNVGGREDASIVAFDTETGKTVWQVFTDAASYSAPVVVRSGRQAILAARGNADTVLVILAARLVGPTALETTQFLQQQGLGDVPPVLVVVDPLDDDGRGKYLTGLILAFSALDRVAIVDRLESLFEPVTDPETGRQPLPPRFPDLLSLAAGPAAVDPTSRNTAAEVRLVRAREALGLLGRLGRRGWDVSPAQETAELALVNQQLYGAAASLLASMGRAGAQAALEREAQRGDLPEPARLVAKSAFEASLERWGILLESGQMLAAYGRYNHAADDAARRAAGDMLDVLEAAGRKNTISPADAAPIRPRR
jgi:hypothetical protein